MRRANHPIVFAMLMAGCTHASPPTPVTPREAPVTPVAEETPSASATFPAPSSQIVAQLIESDERVPMTVLEDGNVVLVDFRGVHLATPGVGIVRRIDLPYDARRVVRGVDPAGRWVATNREFVSFASGTVRGVEDTATIAGCAIDGSRCVVVAIGTPQAFAVRIERPDGGEPLDRFELPLPFGGDRANEIDVAHVEAAIDGDRLALLLPTFGLVIPAVYAIGTRTVVAKRPPNAPSGETLEFVGDRLLISSRQRLSLVDPNDEALATIASLHAEHVMDTRGAAFATVRLEGTWTIVDRRTLGRTEAAVREHEAPFVGAGRTAYVGDTDVTWVDGASTRSVPYPPASVPYGAAMTARGLYVFHDGHGISVFAPDATEATFTPIGRIVTNNEPLDVRVLERGLSIAFGETSIAIGDGEPPSSSATPRDRYGIRREAAEAAMSRLAAGHHADSPGLVALPIPGSRLGVAFVEGGNVHVLDATGAPVGRPTPLPRNVRRSGCYSLDFLSDVELGLHGRRPCLPTRIRFGAATFESLGRAFVDVASTPDGSRVAVMANRRVLVLDGRTGATLVDVDPHVISPRNIHIADDGSEAVLFGADIAVVDLGPLAAPDATRRVVHLPNPGFTYSERRARLVGCDDHQLVSVAALSPDSTQRWPAAACRDGDSARPMAIEFERVGATDPRVTSLSDDFVVLSATNSMLSIVRLRDGAEMRVALLRTREVFEAIVTLGDRTIAVFPPAPSTVLSIGPGGRRTTMPTATPESAAAIAAFFTP